jgi:hypothetical protein
MVPRRRAVFGTVIRVPLKRETTSVAVQARQRAALGVWDRVREMDGLGRWCVAYVGAGGAFSPDPASLSLISERGGVAGPSTSAIKEVTACVRREADVHVPHVGDLVQSTEEDAEDHQERLEALLEWVGMACLGAQRHVSSHHESSLENTSLLIATKQTARQRSRRAVRRRVRSALASLDRRRHASTLERLDGRHLCPVRDRYRHVRVPPLFLFVSFFSSFLVRPRGRHVDG